MPPMHISARHRLPDETRALWVVRTSMVSPQAIERAVALAARYGFNALFAQVRGRGDAYPPCARRLLAKCVSRLVDYDTQQTPTPQTRRDD